MTRQMQREVIALGYQVDKLINFYELPVPVKKVFEGGLERRIDIGPFSFFLHSKRCSLYKKYIDLSPNQFDILYTICRKRGKMISEEEIHNDIWGDTEKFNPGIIPSHYIYTIRTKIGARWIKVKYKKGYYLNLKSGKGIAAPVA